jgi:hypothetical protein
MTWVQTDVVPFAPPPARASCTVDVFIASELVTVTANLLVGRMTRPPVTIRNTACIRQVSIHVSFAATKDRRFIHKPPSCQYGAPASQTRHRGCIIAHGKSNQFALRPTNMQNVMNAMTCYDPILTYNRPHLIHSHPLVTMDCPSRVDPSSSIGGCLCIADRTRAARQNGVMQNG